MTRYTITHGQLNPEPIDFDAAQRDRQALQVEIERCELQLRDPQRPLVYKVSKHYDEWKDKAVRALRTMHRVAVALDHWLTVNRPSLYERAVRGYAEMAGEVDDLDASEETLRLECEAWIAEHDGVQKKARTA